MYLDKGSWCCMLCGAWIVSCLWEEISTLYLAHRHLTACLAFPYPVLVAQTPPNIFWISGKTSFFLAVTSEACFLVSLLFQVKSQLLLGVHEDELLPQARSWLRHCASPPSWHFCLSCVLSCPLKRHHLLLLSDGSPQSTGLKPRHTGNLSWQQQF